jgi:phosphomannomutase
MTRQEFLDKEHEFIQSNDTDVVKFYHNIIMQIFNEQDDEITKTLEMGREGLLKVSSDLLDEKTKKIEQLTHDYILEMKENFVKQYEKEHEMKVTFEGAESEEGEQVFTLPDQLDELIENVHNYAVHNCDFKVNGKYYGGI